jgi:hypothetical protein
MVLTLVELFQIVPECPVFGPSSPYGGFLSWTSTDGFCLIGVWPPARNSQPSPSIFRVLPYEWRSPTHFTFVIFITITSVYIPLTGGCGGACPSCDTRGLPMSLSLWKENSNLFFGNGLANLYDKLPMNCSIHHFLGSGGREREHKLEMDSFWCFFYLE